MAHSGGAHGGDVWLPVLNRLIADEPEPATLNLAIAPLADVGVDVVAVLATVNRFLDLAQADWHRDDWRHTHPGFPGKYAGVAHIYTLQDPNVYTALGAAMHSINRSAGPGGVSPEMRACLPFIKLLDVALIEAVIVWGFFTGETLRGVKHAFPQPTVADHDPKRHFMPNGVGRELHWLEFNSSATNPQVMYRPYFCGRQGKRTLFTVQSVEGVSIKKFSALPDEEEVLFRPLARFKVTGCTKLLTAGDLRDDAAQPGFPDQVQLQQLPTFDPMAALRARTEQLAAKDTQIVELEHRIRELVVGGSSENGVALQEAVPPGGAAVVTAYLCNVGHPSFLDCDSAQPVGTFDVTLWGDGVDFGPIPENLQWQLKPVVGEADTFFIVSKAHEKFLDSHGNRVRLWGDGVDIGQDPDGIKWRRQAVEGQPNTFFLIHVKTNKFLDSPGGSPVALWGDGVDVGLIPQNLQWRLRVV